MARVIQNQRNPWGAQAALDGEEPQRSDLWVVDLSPVIRGVATQLNVNLPPIPAYFAQTVAIPELRVRPEVIRRDSRPYNMPCWDDPLDPVKITFILDAGEEGQSSRIYQVLDSWRSLVRAGRGAMSKESSVVLNNSYRIDFQYNINIMLLKGGNAVISQSAQKPTDILVQAQRPNFVQRISNIFTLQKNNGSTVQKQLPTSAGSAIDQQNQANEQAAAAAASAALLVSNTTSLFTVDNDLQISGAYTLVNAWVASFRISDLNYGNAALSMVEASFYAEDVYDQNNKTNFE